MIVHDSTSGQYWHPPWVWPDNDYTRPFFYSLSFKISKLTSDFRMREKTAFKYKGWMFKYFETGNTLLCGWKLEHAKCITIQVVVYRKHSLQNY